jgi:hypothetical protein
MTENESDYVDMPSGKVARIKYSISNLWDSFGRTDSLGLGVIINLSMILLGIIVYMATSGLLSYVGVVWALFNCYPFVQWVFGL